VSGPDPEVANSIELFGSLSEYSASLYPAMEVLAAPAANAIAVRFTVQRQHLNGNRTLHGGCIATIVDVLTSIAIRKLHRDGQSGVTASLTVECVNAAQEAEELLVVATVSKIGKNLAFTSCRLSRFDDPTYVIATGAHTKFLGASKL
jgi:acyl-coenzyme A thioesterase 13